MTLFCYYTDAASSGEPDTAGEQASTEQCSSSGLADPAGTVPPCRDASVQVSTFWVH